VDNINIVLAHSNPIMRRSIRRLVNKTSGIEIVGEASEGQGLLDVLEQGKPDLVIYDIFLPHIQGLEAIKIIKTNYPQINIIIISTETDIEILMHALHYGAKCYLLEEDVEMALIDAIEMIKRGGIFVSPAIIFHLSKINIKEYIDKRGRFRPLCYRLSDREKSILELISKGNSNHEIASLLKLSIKTIHNHRTRIMRKLHCRHSTDLTRYAIKKLPLFL
jgi:two-component system, NarL family, response regulator NreC